MPVYCYQSEKTGQIIERVFPVGQAPKSIKVCGDKAIRSFAAENVGVPAPGGWPMECIASGVHAEQAGELKAHFDKAGVPTEVTKDGNPVYRDSHHRKKALKARGLHDRAAYL